MVTVGTLIEKLKGLDADMDVVIEVQGTRNTERYLVDSIDNLGVHSLVLRSTELDQVVGPVQDGWDG